MKFFPESGEVLFYEMLVIAQIYHFTKETERGSQSNGRATEAHS